MTPLASILVAAHPVLAAPDLEQRLDALLAAARRVWPTVRCDEAQFIAHLAAQLPSDGDAARAFSALHATDLYLAFACAQGIPAAITAFEREHLSQMSRWIARVDWTPDFVDEVRQRVRERLLVGARPRIASFNGSGPLAGWVRVAAVRIALDTRKELVRNAPAESSEEPAAPELKGVGAGFRSAVEAALKGALARLSSEDRELLRLHYIDGITLQELGRQRNTTRSTMSRRVSVVRRGLLDEVKRELERTAPAMTTASRDSLLKDVRSKLDISLSTLFKR